MPRRLQEIYWPIWLLRSARYSMHHEMQDRVRSKRNRRTRTLESIPMSILTCTSEGMRTIDIMLMTMLDDRRE